MVKQLSPDQLASAIRGGLDYLELNRKLLDRLNVFPVPDGDTGGNMTSSLAAGVENLTEAEGITLSEMSRDFVAELNRCSRGNSGFILARFFFGFFEAVGKDAFLTPRNLAAGIANGSYTVNGALFSPTEGTMISILAAISRTLADYAGDDVVEALRIAEESGTAALFKTPEQLPILARAGVIDSGALGLLFIIRGMIAALTGSLPVEEEEADYRFQPDPSANSAEERPHYRYCTEAIVRREGPKDADLSEWLGSMGDSIALVDEQDLLKVHIHTNEPEAVFERLKTSGYLERTKVDDMDEQTRLVSAGSGDEGECAVLSFIPGEGFGRIFEDLEITDCFLYGDVLPSPEEILEALEHIEEDHVIVLPNNSNIIPSVLAAKNDSSKSLSIVPTKSVIQGITASYGFSKEESAVKNVESMMDFIDDAVGLFVYKCGMDTRFGELDLEENDWFVTHSDEILGKGLSPSLAVSEALKKLETDEFSDCAVYHGDGFDPRNLEAVLQVLSKAMPGAEIVHHFGGQTKAALIISLE